MVCVYQATLNNMGVVLHIGCNSGRCRWARCLYYWPSLIKQSKRIHQNLFAIAGSTICARIRLLGIHQPFALLGTCWCHTRWIVAVAAGGCTLSGRANMGSFASSTGALLKIIFIYFSLFFVVVRIISPHSPQMLGCPRCFQAAPTYPPMNHIRSNVLDIECRRCELAVRQWPRAEFNSFLFKVQYQPHTPIQTNHLSGCRPFANNA